MNANGIRALALGWLGLVVSAGAAIADTGGGTAAGPNVDPFVQSLLDRVQVQAKNKSLFQYDYGIPTSPALTLVGTSTAISAPSSSLKPFVFAVPASWGGAAGNDAFSVDFSAMWMLGGLGSVQDQTYDEYLAGGWANHLAYRTRFEGALFLGADGNGDASKAQSSRLAFGLSTSLLDDSDPLAASAPSGKSSVWEDCVNGVFYGPEVTKYIAAYNGDAAVVAYNEFLSATAKLRVAGEMSGTPPAALVSAGFADLDNCLKTGHCAGDDPTGALAAANTAKDLAAATKAIQTITATLKAAAGARSQTLSGSFGVVKAMDECVAAANAAARLGADLEIGGGAVWTGTPGKAEGFKDMGGAIWLSGRLPLGVFGANAVTEDKLSTATPSFMLGGSLRASWNETVATGATAAPSIKADVYSAWAGLEYITATTRVTAQIGYDNTSATDAAFKMYGKSGTRWLATASIRADKLFGGLLDGTVFTESADDPPKNGVWLNASYGSAQGSTTTLDDKMVLVSLSYSPTDVNDLFGGGAL